MNVQADKLVAELTAHVSKVATSCDQPDIAAAAVKSRAKKTKEEKLPSSDIDIEVRETRGTSIKNNTETKEKSADDGKLIELKENCPMAQVEIKTSEFVFERRKKRKSVSTVEHAERKMSCTEILNNMPNVERDDDEIVFKTSAAKQICESDKTKMILTPSSRKRYDTYIINQPLENVKMEEVKKNKVDSRMETKKVSQIPRFNAAKDKPSIIKPFSSEYWSKIHQKEMNQMDSLEDYMQKKKLRAHALLSPSGKSTRKVDLSKKFTPTVFSTSKMNMNFTQMFQTTDVVKTETGHMITTRKSIGTPFNGKVFTGGCDVSSTQKPKFDLQASLARPVTWNAYSGRIKETYIKDKRMKENVRLREERRKDVDLERLKKRESVQQKRRGILKN